MIVHKTNLIQTIVFTLLGINLMLIALIIGKESIPLTSSIPSMSQETSVPQRNIEYGMEKIGTDRMKAHEDGNGFWIVEHYKEYEYHYDEQGRFIEKRPTAKEEHLRYWQPAKSSIHIDQSEK